MHRGRPRYAWAQASAERDSGIDGNGPTSRASSRRAIERLRLSQGQSAASPFAPRKRIADAQSEGHDFGRVSVDLAAIAQIVPLPIHAKGRGRRVDDRRAIGESK